MFAKLFSMFKVKDREREGGRWTDRQMQAKFVPEQARRVNRVVIDTARRDRPIVSHNKAGNERCERRCMKEINKKRAEVLLNVW